MTERSKIIRFSACDIERLLFRMSSQFTPPLSQQFDIQGYAIKLSERAEFLILDDEQVDSLVAFYTNHKEHKAYIPLVWVDGAKRRRGIGACMLTELHRHIKSEGIETVGLEVHKNNLSAFSLYSRLGYRVVEDRNDKWLMCFDL